MIKRNSFAPYVSHALIGYFVRWYLALAVV